MPEVRQTLLAGNRVAGLRGPNRKAYEAFLDELARTGCQALGYRLTGPVVEHLCVKHVRGALRAVVAFTQDDVAWVLLVGVHVNDTANNVYDELYEMVGHRPEPSQKRTKPPCCDPVKVRPAHQFNEDEISELVERVRRFAKRARR